jgi:hypothetical protein
LFLWIVLIIMPKTHKVLQSFNAGELSPLMDARLDQQKYAAGCRTMENMIPLIYGGAQERPGLKYIASQKTASAKGRVVAFEHSVDDTYILLFENQVIRFFKDGSQVNDGVGTEDISGLDNIIAHWLLNDSLVGTTVIDDDGNTHDGTASTNTNVLSTTGKVNNCFDLDGQYTVEIADSNDFSFTDNSDDSAFSIACWAYVKQHNDVQVLLSKWRDVMITSEWRFSLDINRKLQLHLSDTSANLESDRVAQWFLNDDAANTAVDDNVASIPHDGVLTPSNTEDVTATGKINACFDFGGAEAVEISDHNELSFDDSGTNPFSIAAWVYVTTTGTYQHIFSKWDSLKREYLFSLDTSDKLMFWIFDESVDKKATITTDAALTNGWHFVVATYDSTGGSSASDGMTLYVDSVAVDTTAVTESGYVAMENLTAGAVIGAAYTGGSLLQFWADKIDNVVLFNIELSQANVSALWNDGNGIETTVSEEVSAVSDDALSVGWHYLACTYSAPSDAATAANGIILYVDGSAVDSTKTNNAQYTAMQNGAEEIRIGSQRNSGDSANEKFWADKIDEMSVYGDVLTPTEVASLYSTSAFEITSPYLTADLPTLKFEQSADVMFITHPSYEPRKLSRLGDTVWTLEELDLRTGPFRDQNTDTSFTITASATTGTVTLTAAGTDNNPFVLGTVAGHEPSGMEATSKSVTGALFKLVHAAGTSNVSDELDCTSLNDATTTLTVPKGITWDWTTLGAWGQAGDSATVVLERSYDSGTTYETVHTVTSGTTKNVTTSGTEEVADALYRMRVSEATVAAAKCEVQFSIRDTSHTGIVEITSVISPTEAIGTVLTTLASTNATHRWSEGSFSNRRGWPIDVTISSEERLTFAGNISEPLTTWGSVIGDFTDFKEGTDDDDALNLTLVGSGQQNRIRWLLSKNTLVLGTVGGEHILGASKDDEALSPSNIRARLQTTYGSENIAAKIVNKAVLFVQRGGRKIRELLYDFEQDSHKADDLTVFSEHITESGIVDMAFQRTPDPILWCVRDDGEMAIMTYERDQNVFSWARIVSEGGTSDAEFESVAVIYGGAGSEDEVWVTVKREINTATTATTVRYVERFYQRAMPSSTSDMKYLDSYITDTGGDTTITGLSHLEGETVQVLGDGLAQATKVVSSGQITAATTASKYQVGLGYTATVKPMKLDLNGMGLTVTKKINRGVFNVFETIGGEVGGSTSTLQDIPTGTAALFTGSKEIPFKDGYSREGDILARQTQPLPMTVLSFALDVGANAD